MTPNHGTSLLVLFCFILVAELRKLFEPKRKEFLEMKR
jgi:hypothetical protein